MPCSDKPDVRDQLAMAALTGMLSRHDMDEELAATRAYKYADAMMGVRSK
jgi:hypothetical protein